MKTRSKVWGIFTVILVVLVLVSGCSSPTPEPTPVPTRALLSVQQQDLADKIDKIFSDLTEKGEFSGAVFVEYQQEILLEKGYGMADRQEEIANAPQTRFRLYSTSKPFPALGVMALSDAGKLNIQDSACEYIDRCPEDWKELKIVDLLNASSGLQDYTLVTDIRKSLDQPIQKKDLLDLVKTIPLDPFALPGTWEGQTDYTLLASIIERVSGQDYEKFMQENVFDPLGLKNTGIVHGVGEKDDLAAFYMGEESSSPERIVDASNHFGNGDLYSSVEDINLLMNALRSRNFLKVDTIDEIFTINNYGSGYGWTTYQYEFPLIWASYVMTNLYQNATIAMSPDGELLIVILVNQDVNSLMLPFPIIDLILAD